MKKVGIFYRKLREDRSTFEMSDEQAAALTLNDILTGWAFIEERDWPDDVYPDSVFASYQDKPLPVYPDGVHHSSMSVGDIITIDNMLHVCLPHGWYTAQLCTLRYVSVISGKEQPSKN